MGKQICIIAFVLFVKCICMKTQGYSNQIVYDANDKTQYSIIGKYPRSGNQLFFTEGLSFIDSNTLLESTGLYGDSEIHFIKNFDQSNSSLGSRYQFSKQYFGEGSGRVVGHDGATEYYMMTYKERTVFVLDENLNKIVRQYEMPDVIKEGWGMTHYIADGKAKILVTDGSNQIFHINPDGFTVEKTVIVNDGNGEPIDQLNELEMYEDSTVLANIWNTNKLARININDGKLVGLYSFQGLIDDLESETLLHNYVSPFTGSVLNGIAYNHESKRLILGGKKWPYWYEVILEDQQN